MNIMFCYTHICTQVIAACGSDAKCSLAKRKGSWQTVNYRTQDLRATVKEITGGDGADIIVDMVGGKMWDQCMRWWVQK